MSAQKVLGVLTGGGDCPGLNPAIKAVTKKALEEGFQVLGIREGWQGLLNKELDPINLTLDEVRHIDRRGGTILGTTRTNPCKEDPGLRRLKERMASLNMQALVVLGGEGTLGACAELYQKIDLPVVGIPKTIDCDLSETEYTLGFESALQVITDSVDSLRSTAESHSRIFVVEVMGRNAGHLALLGGISAAASVILIPEVPFSLPKVGLLLKRRRERGVRYSIVLVAEGAVPEDDKGLWSLPTETNASGRIRLGGIGAVLAQMIEKETGLETRSVILSHLQRGGRPVSYDRRMGFYFGIAAVEAVVQKSFGQMVALKNGSVTLAPLEKAVKKLRTVDVDLLYDTECYRRKLSVLHKQAAQQGNLSPHSLD